MEKYGKVAVLAAESIRAGLVTSPADAWADPVRKIFPASSALQNKGCPKGAFLGLCNRGMIEGVPTGEYSKQSKNGEYAVAAVEILRVNRFLASQPDLLWKKAAGGSKTEDGQMAVVTGLWKAGLIRA